MVKWPPDPEPSPKSLKKGKLEGLQNLKQESWKLAKEMKALVKWPPDPEPSPKSHKKGELRKRLQRGASGKVTRDGPGQEGSNVLKKLLQRERRVPRPLRPASALGRPQKQQILQMESESSEGFLALGQINKSNFFNSVTDCVH